MKKQTYSLWEHFWSKINWTIRVLIISDFFMFAAAGLLSPIFAIYITNQIEGAGLEVVGFSTTIYLLSKSLAQLPVASLIDRIKGELDDFWILVIGTFITSLVPLLYLLASTPLHLYLIQLLFGLLIASTYPTWTAIFTRHIDSYREGYEWSLYNTLTDIPAAATAALGGYIAAFYGFNSLFIVISIMGILGAMALLLMKKDMYPAPKRIFSSILHFKR